MWHLKHHSSPMHLMEDAEKHRCVVETPKYYKLFVVVVKDQKQAVEVCKKVVKEEGIQAILLCPGFTHRDIAEISEAVSENVGIFVDRGDVPSNRIVMEVMRRVVFRKRGEIKFHASLSTSRSKQGM